MRPPQAQLRPMPWLCAHPSATMCTAAVCSTFLSTCRHRSLVATCRRDLASSSVRRLGEAEAWFELCRGGQTFFGQDTGPQQLLQLFRCVTSAEKLCGHKRHNVL